MSDSAPSEAELMLSVSTIIRESIIESIKIDSEEQVEDLIADMVNGLIDTLGIDFLAWAPQTGKALISLDIANPVEYFE